MITFDIAEKKKKTELRSCMNKRRIIHESMAETADVDGISVLSESENIGKSKQNSWLYV